MSGLRRFFKSSAIRWIALIGFIILTIIAVSIWLAQVYIGPITGSGKDTLTWLLAGAVVCLIAGISGLLIGFNRLWSANRLKNNSSSPSRVIAWIAVLGVGLPWLASGLPGQAESFFLGKIGSYSSGLGGWNSFFSWPRTTPFYLLQPLVLGVLLYAFLWNRKRQPPVFLPGYRGGIWPLVAGGLAGLGCWLAAVFLKRLLTAFVPALSLGYLAQNPSELAGWSHWANNLIFVGIAPLVEEVFLRGYVLPAWTGALGMGRGWIATALLSAALTVNPLAFPAVFLFSLGMGWLVSRVKHLAPAWVAHLVFNGLFMVLMPF